jgi:hypothetical protein
MAKRPSADTWLRIKTKYEFGDPVRAIAREFGIADTSIRQRAIKENWSKKTSEQVADIKSKIRENSQVILAETSQEQLPYVEDRLKQEIDDCWQITKTITNLDKGALNLAGMILKKTIHQTQSGEITPREASQVLSGTGMRVDQVYSRYAPQQATTAIQINNDNNRVIVELVD